MWHRERPAGHARSWRTLLPERPSRADSALAVRGAVRVTVAAVAGFYPAIHLLDRPVLALYTLFVPVAFGLLSPLPGAGRRRARHRAARRAGRCRADHARYVSRGGDLVGGARHAARGVRPGGRRLPRAPGGPASSPLSSSATSWPASRRTRRGRCRTGSPGSPSARRRRSCANGCCCRSPSSRRTAHGSPTDSNSPRAPCGGCCGAAPTAGRRPSGCGRRAGSCACHGRRPASGPPERGARDRALAQAGYATRRFLDLLAVPRRCCARRSTCPRPHCCAGSPPPAPTRPPPCAARALRPASSGSRR